MTALCQQEFLILSFLTDGLKYRIVKLKRDYNSIKYCVNDLKSSNFRS
jgi:hypothetical protein